MAASSSKRDSVTRPQPQDERNYQSDPEVRKVVLINNGDKLSRGRPFVFNVNKVTHWDSLLQDFSDHVRPAYGIVRKVYTPNQGTEVTNVQDISQNGVYIVSGTEKFKPIPNGYNADTIIDQPFTHAPRGSIGIQLKPEKVKEAKQNYFNLLWIVFYFHFSKLQSINQSINQSIMNN